MWGLVGTPTQGGIDLGLGLSLVPLACELRLSSPYWLRLKPVSKRLWSQSTNSIWKSGAPLNVQYKLEHCDAKVQIRFEKSGAPSMFSTNLNNIIVWRGKWWSSLKLITIGRVKSEAKFQFLWQSFGVWWFKGQMWGLVGTPTQGGGGWSHPSRSGPH